MRCNREHDMRFAAQFTRFWLLAPAQTQARRCVRCRRSRLAGATIFAVHLPLRLAVDGHERT